jgi:hypothetical protein
MQKNVVTLFQQLQQLPLQLLLLQLRRLQQVRRHLLVLQQVLLHLRQRQQVLQRQRLLVRLQLLQLQHHNG